MVRRRQQVAHAADREAHRAGPQDHDQAAPGLLGERVPNGAARSRLTPRRSGSASLSHYEALDQPGRRALRRTPTRSPWARSSDGTAPPARRSGVRIIAGVREPASMDTLTYAANWDRTTTQVPFWDAVDAIGIQSLLPARRSSRHCPSPKPSCDAAWRRLASSSLERLRQEARAARSCSPSLATTCRPTGRPFSRGKYHDGRRGRRGDSCSGAASRRR